MIIYLGRGFRARLTRPTQDFPPQNAVDLPVGRKERVVPQLDDFWASLRLFFGLSPGGVCHASLVTSGPVVFYTAVSP